MKVNKYQENGYDTEAKMLETRMRADGKLSSDIVEIATRLLRGNLSATEQIAYKEAALRDLLERAGKVLDDKDSDTQE